MRFVIVGPGALGTIFAARLGQAGNNVALLGRPSPHFDAIRDRGLRLRDMDCAISLVPASVSDDPAVVADADVLLVLVKTGDTVQAMARIQPYLRQETVVITMQNGLDNAGVIRSVLGPGPCILPAVTSQAGTRYAPDLVVHAGEGPTLIGFVEERDAAIAATVARTLEIAGLPSESVADIDVVIWRKAAINAAINGLTAVGGFPNGEIAANSELLAAAELIAEEAAAVARAHGVEIGPIDEAVLETATATAPNHSSMLQDLTAGRVTEVDSIHGAIQDAARSAGVATPALDVTTALIRAMSNYRNPEERTGAENDQGQPRAGQADRA